MTQFEEVLAKVRAEADEQRRVALRLERDVLAGKLEAFKVASIGVCESIDRLMMLVDDSER